MLSTILPRATIASIQEIRKCRRRLYVRTAIARNFDAADFRHATSKQPR
jgi:hypothetical protein